MQDLALQQTQLQHELQKVQQERDSNRARLLSYIYNGIDKIFLYYIYFIQKYKEVSLNEIEKNCFSKLQLLTYQ